MSIDLCRGFGDEDFLFFGMSSKHHLNSVNVHSRRRYRDSELVFCFRIQYSPKELVWETAVLWTSDAYMPP